VEPCSETASALPPPPWTRRLSISLLCVTVGACGAGWHQPEDLAPGAFSEHQQVRVWEGDRTLRCHALLVTADSVSGIHWLEPVTCDSCRVTLARAQVDSLQFGNPVAGFWKTSGLVIAVLGVSSYCAVYGCF
jgi:hypothetical protein